MTDHAAVQRCRGNRPADRPLHISRFLPPLASPGAPPAGARRAACPDEVALTFWRSPGQTPPAGPGAAEATVAG